MAIIRRKQLTDTSFIKLAFSIYLAFSLTFEQLSRNDTDQ